MGDVLLERSAWRVAGAAVCAAALVAATVQPAAAAGDTGTTFTLTGGTLSVTVAATATLTAGTTTSASVSGKLGTVTVTDGRTSTTVWSANATSTTFTRDAGATTSTGVSYNAGTITTTGPVVMPLALATALNGTPAKVAGPAAITGDNTASWNPTLTVSLPSNALAGTYSGTVNTSVS